MRKPINIVIASAIAVLTLACTKENVQAPSAGQRGTIDISVEGIIDGYSSQEETKAAAQTVVRIMWAGGEQVYAYEGSEYLGALTASIDDTDGTYAKLSGTIGAPSAGKTVTLVYSPMFDEAPAVNDGKIALDISTQSKNDVPFLIYGVLPDATEGAVSGTMVKFALATSVYKCNCADLPEGKLTNAVIDRTNTVCELALSDSAEPSVGGSAPGSITRINGFTSADSDQRAIFSIALAKTDESAGRTIRVVKGGKLYEAAFAKRAFAPAKSFNGVFMFKDCGALTGRFTVNAEGKQVRFSKGNLIYDVTAKEWGFYDHQYDHATAYDDKLISLFCWGYTEESVKPDSRLVNTTFVDWGTQVGEGSTWRTLSNSEWHYLLSDNGVRGGRYKTGVTVAGNANCLAIYPDDYSGDMGKGVYDPDEYEAATAAGVVFLPAAYWRDGTTVRGNGNETGYWSSTFDVEYNMANYLYFTGWAISSVSDDSQTYVGHSVRLVTDDCKVSFTVRFDNNGHGTTTTDITDALLGTIISKPEDPAAGGYTFGGWYKEKECIEEWNFAEDEVKSDITLYAKWEYTGVLPGRFTVNAEGKQVCFSSGNLIYDVTNEEWGFYDHQYDYATEYDDKLISLFCWGYSEESVKPDSKTSNPAFVDWGTQVGDGSTWRTLTDSEWHYLFSDDKAREGRYKAGVTVVGNDYCLAIYPDDYSGDMGKSVYDPDEYEAATAAGVVFLPCAYERKEKEVWRSGTGTGYWSSTYDSEYNMACYLYFAADDVSSVSDSGYGFYGNSVRLVSDCR